MPEDKKIVVEIPGLEPVGEAVLVVAQGAVDGASAFLSRICLPAAKEFGLLLKDTIHSWRKGNVVATVNRSEQIAKEQGVSASAHAHPRLVSHIIDEASWVEDAVVQDLWAGLLASSCTESGDDDSNLLFTNLLSQLTKVQARIINYSCERCAKRVAPNGLLDVTSNLGLKLEALQEITGESDIHRLDRELDHLRELGLLLFYNSGFDMMNENLVAWIGATPLALQMYVRCRGSRKSPVDFFGLESECGPSKQEDADKPQAGDAPSTVA